MQSPKLSSRYNISSAVLLAGIVLALYLRYRLAIPFLSPLVWSFTLAVLFRPLCRRLGIRCGLRERGGVGYGRARGDPGRHSADLHLWRHARGGRERRRSSFLGRLTGHGTHNRIPSVHSQALSSIDQRLDLPTSCTITGWPHHFQRFAAAGVFRGFLNLLLTFLFPVLLPAGRRPGEIGRCSICCH